MEFKAYFIVFLEFAFLFMVGSMLGWCLELVYRRFFSKNNPEHKWINPGFLTGPCVPLYGFGLCALFFMANFNAELGTGAVNSIIRIILMSVSMTVIEYVAGIVFIKGMNVKLWDYSGEWGNIQGIICPKFSFYWTVLAVIFYFGINPFVASTIVWFVSNVWFSYFVGIFNGFFIIDFCVSLNLMNKIRAFAKEHEIVVRTEELKQHIVAFKEEHHIGGKFMLALQTSGTLLDRLDEYIDKIKEKREHNKWN